MHLHVQKTNWDRWRIVVLFAVAMAWVESAAVDHLRTHIDRIVPYQANPLPTIGGLGPVEMTREFATLVMPLTVGMLAGHRWRWCSCPRRCSVNSKAPRRGAES